MSVDCVPLAADILPGMEPGEMGVRSQIFGRNLTWIADFRGWTRRELARRAGLSPSMLSMITFSSRRDLTATTVPPDCAARKLRGIGLDLAVRVSDRLGIPLAILVDCGDDWPRLRCAYPDHAALLKALSSRLELSRECENIPR